MRANLDNRPARVAATLSAMILLAASGCTTEPTFVPQQKATAKKTTETVAVTPAPPSEIPVPQPSNAGFVGSQACAECHADLHRSYQTHPMAHSMGTVAREDVVEDFSNAQFSPQAHLSYRVERAGDEFWHHERQEDANGQEIYDQRVKVDFSVGSGARGRSFLSNRDGRLYQSPISWYSSEPNWALSPGYAVGFNERFERRVTHACLSCHAGLSQPHESEMDRFAEPPFTELSIGCERCHGPGADHVAYRRTPEASRTMSDPIVNPSALPTAKQDAICNQCHLQGKRRVLRDGHSEFDFRPGMSLNELWITVLKTEGVQRGTAAAVSQVEQMYASKCFQESAGRMTCTNCHDPHRSPSKEEAVAFYRERCVNCHDAGQTVCSEPLEARTQRTAEDSCIVCHMPKFDAADVHAAQTDHRVPRTPQPAPVEDSGQRVAKALKIILFDEPGTSVSADEQNRARGIYLAEIAFLSDIAEIAEQAVDMLRPVVDGHPDDLEARFSLGKALLQTNQTEDALKHLGEVLQRRPNHEDCLEMLASFAHQKGDLAKAGVFYEKLIAVNPDRSRYYGRFAHVLGQQGNMTLGVEMIRKALELDPSLQQGHGWLKEVYQQLGKSEEAGEHARILRMFESLRKSP